MEMFPCLHKMSLKVPQYHCKNSRNSSIKSVNLQIENASEKFSVFDTPHSGESR